MDNSVKVISGIAVSSFHRFYRNSKVSVQVRPVHTRPCALPLIVDIAAADQAGFDQRAST